MSESDNSLIAEFNARRSEDAFAGLVRQHINLVFATAFRQVGDAGAAEEITQNVFVALAQAAGKLGTHPTLAGWLHQTTLNKSREWLRAELRRHRREQVAVNLELAGAEGNSVWSPLVPLLDEALLKFREPDRQAIILHYMEGRTFQEVGSALGVGEDAARKRVNRCLDQLTDFFRRRGFATPALASGTPLFALASHGAPAELAASAATAGLAAAHSAATTSTLTLVKGALKIMAWTKAKTAAVAGLAVILSVGTYTVVDHVAHVRTAEHGKQILAKVVAANRYWLLAPPATVAKYSYVFHLDWQEAPGGVMETPIQVTNPRRANPEERQGITYSSLLQRLARTPDRVKVKGVKEADGKITLALEVLPAPGTRTSFVVSGKQFPIAPLRIDCGNGISRMWRGHFQTGGTHAVLVIDAARMVPLDSVVTVPGGTVEELSSDYAEVEPGSYVPQSVTVKYADSRFPKGMGNMQFDWTFKLHDGLWLFDHGQYRGKRVAWTDHVVVN